MQITPLRPEWLPTHEAAARLGVHRRTLQRRARAGQIESRYQNGVAEYLVPHDPNPRGNATPPPAAATGTPPVDQTPEIRLLLSMLDEANRERREAERRANEAEFKAALSAVDPDEYRATIEALATVRAELDQTRRERDEARADGLRLADAMRKRYAVIQRLTRRLRDAGE